MKEYIERESFIADQRHLYCDNCDRRRGMKDGKLTKRFVYAIGDAPCRACGIGDMLDSIEDYVPAADVVPVRHGRWIDRLSKRGYGVSTYCSCCGQHSGIGGIESNRHRAYCPNCGARMDGDGDV